MKIGFTGTRKGMTDAQKQSIHMLRGWNRVDEVHHGDCIGADTDMHHIARNYGITIVGHPAVDPKERAFNDCDVLRPEKEYIARNHDIVDEVDVMIATPAETEPKWRGSGTWATIRYANNQVNKPLIIVWPDGTVFES